MSDLEHFREVLERQMKAVVRDTCIHMSECALRDIRVTMVDDPVKPDGKVVLYVLDCMDECGMLDDDLRDAVFLRASERALADPEVAVELHVDRTFSTEV